MSAQFVVMTADGLIVEAYDDAQDAFSRRASYNLTHIWDQTNPAEVYEWVDEPNTNRRYLRLVDRVAMMHELIAAAACEVGA
jgi:hypothetical protein